MEERDIAKNLSNIRKEEGISCQSLGNRKKGKNKEEASNQPTRILARRGVKSTGKYNTKKHFGK